MVEKPTYAELEKKIQELEKVESERKLAEDELQMSEEKFRVLFKKSIHGILIVDIETRRFPYANPAFCRMFGYSETEMLQIGVEDIHPKDALDYILSVFSHQKQGEKGATELPCIHKDGTVFTADIAATNIVINHQECVVGFFIDITERKQVEEVLKLFKESVDNSSDAVGMSTPEGSHYYQNKVFDQMFGTIGENPPETLYVNQEIGEEVFKAIMSGGQWTGEVKMYAKDKTIRDIFLRAYANKDEHGNITALVGIHTNITKRKLAEERLVSLNRTLEQKVKKRTNELRILNEHLIDTEEKERSKIAADLHDTVLQSLAFSVSKIKTMVESDDANNTAVLLVVQELIEQSLNEARQLINWLCPPVLKDFDIATAIDFLVEEINKKFHADIQYINTFDNSIDIDETKKKFLYRAANELILNILKHSGVKKGKIELSKNQDAVLLKVDDNGIGFDITTILKNPFNGFGLFSLSERCKNMGGHIKIQSIPGECTKAVLQIPLN